MMLRASYILRV